MGFHWLRALELLAKMKAQMGQPCTINYAAAKELYKLLLLLMQYSFSCFELVMPASVHAAEHDSFTCVASCKYGSRAFVCFCVNECFALGEAAALGSFSLGAQRSKSTFS